MLSLPTTVTDIQSELDSGNPRGYLALNDIMEFDHPVTVHDDGTVTKGPADVYAPDLYDEELSGEGWEFFSTGYTGQDGYSGPIMHNSEFVGGNLARDILSEPGTYATVVAHWSPDHLDVDDIPENFPVRPIDEDDDAEDRATCGTCELSWDDSIPTEYTPAPSARCPFEAFHPETDSEGWAIARLVS